jgi:hypothetical protein
MAPPLSKAWPSKKIGVVKVIHLRVKIGSHGMSEIELVLANPIGVSNTFCLLDVAAPSHMLNGAGPTTARASEHGVRVVAFDNLSDDSSPDVCKTPSPKKAREKRVTPPPSISCYFLCCSFALLPWALMTVLQMLLELHL